ncbi:MAG: hypothetical protein JSR82_13175 [Verrucomicrobia bacterium]|nr:hypothetical protein [Verrucomicrobiota bacterium]
MKHYVIEVIYRAPLPEIEAATPAHRDFLQGGIENGTFLFCGPMVPRTSGMFVARSASREALDAYLAQDPFAQQKLVEFRVIEVNPVKRQPFLDAWFNA